MGNQDAIKRKTSLIELSESALCTIHPNPTNGNLVIEIDPEVDPATIQIEIINAQGQIVFAVTPEMNTENMDIRFLSTGLYYLVLHDALSSVTFKLNKF